MTPRQQRALQKQLLLLKGEALRLRIRLELQHSREVARSPAGWWSCLRPLLDGASLLWPDSRLARLNRLSRLAWLWPWLRRWLGA
jgi:hypothetical protein